MQASEIIELAAIVALHGAEIVHTPGPAPEGAIQEYWAASKCRLNRWASVLKRFSPTPAPLSGRRRQPGPAVFRAVLEEMVSAEILTRVWAALMQMYDRYHEADQMAPVAHSIFSSHMEARTRMLSLLLTASGIDTATRSELNELRCQADRWADVLIGSLAEGQGASEYAVDPERASNFAEDQSSREQGRTEPIVRRLMLSGLKSTFQNRLRSTCPSADLNAEIAASVLSFFPPKLMVDSRVTESLWLFRLRHAERRLLTLVDQLLAEPVG